MRRILLFALLLLPQLLVAQIEDRESLPLQELGRSWNYVRTNADGTTDKVSLKLTESLPVGTETACRLSYCTPEDTVARYAVLEKDGLLWLFDTAEGMKEYGMQPTEFWMGAAYYIWNVRNNGQNTTYRQDFAGAVRVQDYIRVAGTVRKRSLMFADGSEDAVDVFVEGVGSHRYGLLSADRYSAVVGDDVLSFESLTDGMGTMLFRADDFMADRLGDFTYRPLLEDSKTWYCASYRSDAMRYDEDGVLWYFQYFIDGDTVINGRNCWKLYANNHNRSGKTEYICAAYEEDRKVFYIDEGSVETQLLYDYSMNVGESISLSLPTNLHIGGGTLQKIGDLYSYGNGQSVHSHHYNTTIWHEGTGSDFGLFLVSFFGRVGANYKLLLCTIDDKIIYDSHDIDRRKLTSVEVPSGLSVNTSALYDLSGRRVKNGELHKGVYIQGGKKFVVK